MSTVALRQLAAVRAYRKQHPEVDWSAHVVYIRREGEGWRGVGHGPGTHLFERRH